MSGIGWLDPQSPDADVIRIMVQVHRGELTPDAAEDWAKANGRPPFVGAIGASPNPMETSAWPFMLGCGKVWGRALWRDAPWHEVQTQCYYGIG